MAEASCSVAEVAARPSRVPAAVRAAAGRISWGLADQAVSSLTNLAVGLVAARSLGLAEFGMFSLAWVTYGVVLNLSRGLATDPLTVRFSGVHPDRWREAVGRATSTALLIGLVTGAACLLVGAAVGMSAGSAYVALGLVLPGLLLQDAWRFAFFAAGQGRNAFANDAVWALGLVPAMLVVGSHGSVFAFVLAWGAAGSVAGVLGYAQSRMLPRTSGIGTWLRQQRDLGLRYMVENVSISSAAQLRMYGLGAIAGLADVGAVRGAQLLLGPFLALLMGTSLVAVPEAARVLRRSPRRLPHFCALLGGGQAGAGALWGLGLLLLLPDAAGRFLLGDVWEPAAVLVVPTMLGVMGASLSDGALAGLRALGAAPRSLRTQVFATVAYVSGGLVGAVLGGALGSAWGVAAATASSATVAWWQLRRGLREHGPTDPPTTPAAAADERHDPTNRGLR
jgi:O-antigen/teichoic acid export membrane protein